MCLQWCYVRSWLIDNDLPCAGCVLRAAALLPATHTCVTCTNRRERDGQPPLCDLTRETLPLAGACCHWNTAPQAPAVLALTAPDLAPWLDSDDVRLVFATSPSAPPLARDPDGRLLVALADLNVPLVYGVPAAAWDTALGWELPVTSWDATTWGSTLDDAPQRAMIAALEALDCGATTYHQRLGDLAVALATTAPTALPEGWHDILRSLIAIGLERFSTNMAIRVRLTELENTLCTLH